MTTTSTKAQLAAALTIAAAIRHSSDRAAGAREDIRAYTAAGLDRMVKTAQATLAQAEKERDVLVTRARETDNPQMARALRVYSIML